jgi:Ni,Fe-hydrogenase I large subunit
MARGLLLYWVQLESHGTVAQYRMLAPTEWNFSPQDALALPLAARAPLDHAAAFDPCVECSVTAPPLSEPCHA